MAHDVPGMLFATTQIQTAHARYRQQSLYFCTVLQNGFDPVLTGFDPLFDQYLCLVKNPEKQIQIEQTRSIFQKKHATSSIQIGIWCFT